MGNSSENSKPPSSDEYLKEIGKRKEWFFECQLRRLYIDAFRDVEPGGDKKMLDLISEPKPSPSKGSTENKPTQVYLDSQQPVWTKDERDLRGLFKDSTNGEGYGSWLYYGEATRLAENLANLKNLFEASKFGSDKNKDDLKGLDNFPREDPSLNNNAHPVDEPHDADRDNFSHAIARAAICEKKPWLIPEIFFNRPISDGPGDKMSEVEKWIENGEIFIRQYEYELNEMLNGGESNDKDAITNDEQTVYRAWINDMLKRSLNPLLPNGNKKPNLTIIEFLNSSEETWLFNIKILTSTYRPIGDLADYPHSSHVKYWIDSCFNKLKEVYVLKSESDMGLCLVMRALYLYGTLDLTAFKDNDLRWRNRDDLLKDYTDPFLAFFDEQKKLIDQNTFIQEKDKLKIKLDNLRNKLKILLEETSASPRTGSICFSPLAQEIIKQDILKYKFWLDETYHPYDYHGEDQDVKKPQGSNKAKSDNGLGGDKGKKLYAEMEYWSENHYIMFASSEYLAGQLWPLENFQPAKDFLIQEDSQSFGVLTGLQRIERGKARVLKWLNNKLMYGWTEFNSSGYYREHLWALLNLVDFAQNEEVQKKATIVTDLLLFDVTRFSHKGSMGACGGRSQFASKNSGWDNALGDAIEIMLGTRGVFMNRDGEIACSFATSTYNMPAVLFEIAKSPPENYFTDRSRASIGFDESPKYGVQYSQKSDQKDSLDEGYQPKRKKHFTALNAINDNIDKYHIGYGAKEDDTVFWWSQSAYFNKQVVRNTVDCIEKFKLHKVPFAKIGDMLGLVAPVFLPDVFHHSIEDAADKLSFFIEGSTRSRVNIHTYRNRDTMLSSIQNFRTGQINIQSNMNQATISTGANVFTTSGFPGFSMSYFIFMALGAGVGAFAGAALNAALAAGTGGVLTAYLGAAGVSAGIGINKGQIEGEDFGDQGDGVGWWTGYWALPMVVQHENASIIIYDFSWLQRRMTDVGSHVWFPKIGFDETQERRTSAYDDDNFFIMDFSLDLNDIPRFGYGARGYWLFGKKIHKNNAQNPDNAGEGYIGVFSNKSPDWQDKNSDFYSDQIEKNAKKKPEDLPIDFFQEKDWFATGKNVWIIQVGNQKEYGSFENFKEKVSSAKVTIDDASDMECAYHIPKPDGTTQVLSVKYKDEIKLDGGDFQVDFYPRFENPFVRGGRVEWGQREYVIEHNGNFLIHDFSNIEVPLRKENEIICPEDPNLVKGLIIYLRTEDQEMEVFTVATATVVIGCSPVATDEVIAAGAVEENNYHDAEWIFFDMSATIDPDMTIDIAHHSIPGKKDDDTKWKMTYVVRALMGDRSLKQCSTRPVPLGTFYFRDNARNTGRVPFSIQLLQWRNWRLFRSSAWLKSWMFAAQPGNDFFYFDYVDELGIDKENILWYRKLGACAAVSDWTDLNSKVNEPALEQPYSLFSFSTQPGYLFLFLISKGLLYARWLVPGQSWSSQPWTKWNISYQPKKFFLPGNTVPPPLPVPLWSLSFVYATFINSSVTTPAVYVSGIDGNIYVSFKWPLDGQGYWRKIETASFFNLLHTITFRVAGDFIFAMDVERALWQHAVTEKEEILPSSWEQLPVPPFILESFVVAAFSDVLQLIACSTNGTIWAIRLDTGLQTTIWQRIGQNIDFKSSPGAEVCYASPTQSRLDIFIVGVDDKLYSTWWTEASGWENEHNWAVVAEDSQKFKASERENLAAISRVNGQIEIYATDSDNNIWKNWWS